MISCKQDKNVTRKLLAGVGRKGEKRGYIDISGNVVIPFEYEVTGEFHCGRAQVCQNGKRGFIDESGNLLYHVFMILYGILISVMDMQWYAKTANMVILTEMAQKY